MLEYSELLHHYKSKNWEDLILAYKGTVTESLLADMSIEIRSKLSKSPKLAKKIFSIFMELAQNILYYSDEQEELNGKMSGIGIIFVTKHDDYYRFSCGNKLHNDQVKKLKEHCFHINTLDREALRDLKRTIRKAPPEGKSKGAGIGLIHVSLTADNPLDTDFFTLDQEYSFFSISVEVE